MDEDLLAKLKSILPPNFKHGIKIIEDITIFTYLLFKSETYTDIGIAIAAYFKMNKQESLLESINLSTIIMKFKSIVTLQSDNDCESGFMPNLKNLRSFLTHYDSIKESPFFQKMYKFIMYCLSLSLFEKFGVTFDTFRYNKIEAEVIRRQYHTGIDFVYCILDTLLFLCEAGYQCMKTGSLDPIYHSGMKYQEWFELTRKMKINSNYLSNPEPHGFNYFEYLSELDSVIEKGEAINKHASNLSIFDKKMVSSVLADMKMIKANELTKKSAMQTRKAPFSILLEGGSSIGKSTLTKLLFYQYAKTFNLPDDPEYMYTRNPMDKHWNNFQTFQYAVNLDDIAAIHPNSANGGDESINEMLQVVNNIPFVPQQADLADKGRTPLKCRLVIASTNTRHLNAAAYFSCPLAIQRRLPYVINVRPKKEYTKNGSMFDGSKVPPLEEGTYPDYWNFIVSRVIPRDGYPNHACYQLEERFEDIYEFMAWYSKAAIEHENMQDKAMNCDKIMSKTKICQECFYPDTMCVCPGLQSNDTYFENTISTSIDNTSIYNIYLALCGYICIFIYFCLTITRCEFLYKYLRYFRWFRSGLHYLFVMNQIYRSIYFHKWYWNMLGMRIKRKIGDNRKLDYTIKILGGIVTIYCGYKITSRLFKKDENILQGSNASKSYSSDIGSTPDPEKEERTNVWYKDDYVTTTFDVSPTSCSWNAFNDDQVMNKLLPNCASFRTFFVRDGVNISRPGKGVFIKGHYMLVNNHSIPSEPDMSMNLVTAPAKDSITTNITFILDESMIKRFPQYDLAIITIKNIPPRKDIINLFSLKSLKGGFNGNYVSRNEQGNSSKNTIHKIKLESRKMSELETTLNIWFGIASTPTTNGDCGSLLVVRSGYGPIILGIHVVAGFNNITGATSVTQEMIKEMLDDPLSVQSGEPVLSAPSAPRVLESLHRKSPIRYTPTGVAAVYGSFGGFRPAMKSRVGPTLIAQSVIKRGYEVKTGPPVMSGWEPWYIAMADMTRPVTKIKPAILAECVENFKHDIFSSLTDEDLKMIQVYDNMTAINGAPRVSYVDKINRNTSAGNPWKKSKKFFMKAMAPCGDVLDPVEFDREIMDRVDDCINKYHNNERYMPSFCAHLKDEATSFKKIQAKKTRVFTGAPVDWTIVVRKYLLSTIRLIQNKRFVFESGPGTIAQSLEWEEIRHYLTAFGDDRMVAGDYGKFDKRMPSTIILAAFDIIESLCKKAGYSEEDLKVVRGIAEDTAFPLIDFNGDLIEFYGSNPSGHPLTVIINGLANSLYMRYCYAVLSGTNSAKDFKQNVHLMTYGDDNCMGVSSKCNFFHHTNIQKVLADVDIVYTMADKDAPSIPYIHIDDVSFLKRTWRWDCDIGAYVGPLDHESIEKMLTRCVQSRSITPQEQSIAVISTALREYFWYGKDVFNIKREMFKEIIDENNLSLYVHSSTLPSWDQLYEEFWDYSKNISERVLAKRR